MMQHNHGRIFIAGASGAIGRQLCRLLVEDGWSVVGTTRSAEKAPMLAAMGVEPAVVDVFHAELLHAVVQRAQPDFVIHQLTDLPPALDPAQMAAALVRNARLREIGTRNLVAAAAAVGVKRMVAQSIAFVYAPGPLPYREEMPLDLARAPSTPTVQAVASLEEQVLNAPFEGIILRYGKLYGPGTGFDAAPSGGPVHVDAAADAARRALTRGEPGIYNIAEDDGTVAIAKATAVLGWNAHFRLPH
ncbi:MAG: NAD-dependent epimerase/dehydratase family protein [Caldilineaceae bacterium]